MQREEVMANALTVIKSLGDWNSRKSESNALQGVVKRDWVPTGRIDFATKLNGNDDPTQPSDPTPTYYPLNLKTKVRNQPKIPAGILTLESNDLRI